MSSFNGEIGRANCIKHDIELEDGAMQIYEPLRRHSEHDREEISKQTAEVLEKEIIEPSTGPWGAPVVLVKKKDDPRGSVSIIAR